jgi:hypothetical protein
MVDLRRIAIIFVIMVLFAILVNAIIGAMYVSPQYDDFCKDRFYPEPQKLVPSEMKSCPTYDDVPSQEELNTCSDDKGYPEYTYDLNGCVSEFSGCNYCQRDFNLAMENYNFIYFVLSSILAIIGIAIGLLLPTKHSLNEWIATGFMLGGLVALFFGTFTYYQFMGRFLKPIIILLELIIVIYLSYRTLRHEMKK